MDARTNGFVRSGLQFAAVALLAAGALLAVLIRGGDDSDVIRRAARPHECDNPACQHCPVNRAWRQAHPDASLGWPGVDLDGDTLRMRMDVSVEESLRRAAELDAAADAARGQ